MLRGILIALMAGAAVCQWYRWPGWPVNVMTLTGLAVAALWPWRPRVRPNWRALPPLHWGWAVAAALAAAYPTLGLDYLSDDYTLLGDDPERGFFPTMSSQCGGPFFRPVGWAVWWVIGQTLRENPTAAHAVALGLYIVNVLLVAPALRRCGAPRNVATWAAVLFAVHPAVVDTLAWLSNIYSLLGLGFSLAFIAALPARTPTLTRMLIPTALAGLAFLSKEDTYLLPLVALTVGPRFRLRELRRWVVASIPIWIVFAGMLTFRFAWFGDVGGYRSTVTGKPIALDRAWLGLWESFLIEAPSRYLLPFRFDWSGSFAARGAMLAMPALLVFGAGSMVVKRSIPRALGLAFLSWAPAGSILPTGRFLDNSRALYGAAVFLAWIVAALLLTAPWNRAIRLAAFAGFVASSLLFGRVNLVAWESSTDQVARVKQTVGRTIRETPSVGLTRILVMGLPDNVKGAVCFRNAGPLLLGRFAAGAGTFVETPPRDALYFRRILWYDAKAGTCQDYLESWGQPRTLTDGQWNVDFRDGIRRPEDVRLHVARGNSNTKGVWTVWPSTEGGAVLLAPLQLAGVKRLRVEFDGDCILSDETKTVCRLVWTEIEGANLVRRRQPLTAPLDIGTESSVVAFELHLPLGSHLTLRKFSVKAM